MRQTKITLICKFQLNLNNDQNHEQEAIESHAIKLNIYSKTQTTEIQQV